MYGWMEGRGEEGGGKEGEKEGRQAGLKEGRKEGRKVRRKKRMKGRMAVQAEREWAAGNGGMETKKGEGVKEREEKEEHYCHLIPSTLVVTFLGCKRCVEYVQVLIPNSQNAC